MALQCGIVGLPNVGKSTLFNALTAAKALAANYPFATKDPNVGIITVPDDRLNELEKIVNPERVLPTTVEIVDIAGLIKGASQGEGLGNQFLANIREVNAILHVVRCFENDNVIHVDGKIDPVQDKEIIDTELLLKDIDAVTKRVEKLKKNAKSGDKEAVRQLEFGQYILEQLEEGHPARTIELSKDQQELMNDMMLLTAKPVLYVCNVDENSVISGNAMTEKFKEAVKDEQAGVILISAEIESEIIQLDDPEERLMFLEEMGLQEPGVNRLIRTSYELLELITYFTAGVKEVRAWTVPKGAKAPQAAGVIHSDFEEGFIRAEVISYEDYIKYGSEAAVKEAGKMAVEGKEYVVQDGDIMHFRFNV
ncbi:redox-regulated ATPase YchF [Membranicola marinus]|uniref:Ribosome-binding ATPase YchF n=1 Tax=Membranihabitans marinus TaxID=1227546 RepID=A0A953HRJ8_9BACT|nr:redox-regulated ATPase YchF [Membranihabitans marinus]MBY5957100.1 redox-regulated ATPase YchF [Membranihabitans marinus]